MLHLLQLDAQLCPRVGTESTFDVDFGFDALKVYGQLTAMELPTPDSFESNCCRVRIRQPGGVGEILFDADGGSWLRGKMEAISVEAINLVALA